MSARESRAALQLVTAEAVAYATDLANRVVGSPEVRRLALLDGVPELIGYYSEGSAALAADFYEEERELAEVRSRFAAEAVVEDRTVEIRRSIAWAASPWFDDSGDSVDARLAEVVQLETARPYRDTITTNRSNDPDAVGWRRVTAGGCPFCRMLADRGAVYKSDTARFASHANCHCVAQPVFTTNDTGVEASVLQYRASRRSRSPEQRAELRQYLEEFYS
ncbi:hypothetical protein ACQ3HE_06700 [Plantibacter auratus]|uniref:VG15 protein n=1 Tax=Plantibacter auratus TaxID=272914 RepID=UPI003D33212B